MGTHNIHVLVYFYGEITKIIPKLSSNNLMGKVHVFQAMTYMDEIFKP